MPLFNYTATLRLKKILDGQKSWGGEARENLDTIDAAITTLMAANKLQVNFDITKAALTNASIFQHNGGIVKSDVIEFLPETGTATWFIGSTSTAMYRDGSEIRLIIGWRLPNAVESGCDFNIYLKSIADGESLEFEFGTPYVLSISGSDTNYHISEIIFSPKETEFLKDKSFVIQIKKTNDSGGLLVYPIEIFDVGVATSYQAIVPEINHNYFDGSAQDSLSTQFIYTDGKITQINEEVLEGTVRVFDLVYNINDEIESITMNDELQEWVETYTYDSETGLLTDITTVITQKP